MNVLTRREASFDIVSHYRKRNRAAEARADGLTRELAKADRLLTLALRVAASGDCKPLALLGVLEEIDSEQQRPEPTIDELAQLLRETDPDRIRA